LSPVGPAFSTAGRVGLAFDVIGTGVALGFVDRPVHALGLFALRALMPGSVLVAVWRRGRRRVEAPLPAGAVVLPERVPVGYWLHRP